jgi:hypothetical protein
MEPQDAATQARARELMELLTTPPPYPKPGEEKLGKPIPLAVKLARKRSLRWLPWALDEDALRQWEREYEGEQYYAAQASITAALRSAQQHEGNLIIW